MHGDQKQGASYGYTKKLGYHPIVAVRADTGELLHIRNRKGKANTQRGAERFLDELLARVRRAGYTGALVIRADVGFENHKLFKILDARGIEFSIGVKHSKKIKRLIEQIPDSDWVTVTDYPEGGEAQIAEVAFGDWRLIVRRTRLIGAQAELFPDWRYHCFITNRTVPMLTADTDHRDHATIELVIRDLKDQALCHFPSGSFCRQQRVDGDRRLGAQPRTVGHPDRAAQRARANRPLPPPPTAPDPRPADPHQPNLDAADARPLALATPVHHRAGQDPGAPRPRLSAPTLTTTIKPTRNANGAYPCAKTRPNAPPGTPPANFATRTPAQQR